MAAQPYLDKLASLMPDARQVICESATEYPYSGAYNEVAKRGSYLCRRCGLALFRASDQFNAGCGWPSFDEAVAGCVLEQPDDDGLRTEIICARCHAHLGHVFKGEGLSAKNLRHCVNSQSLDFVQDCKVIDSEEAILAGGCFWGVDYWLRQIQGVLRVEVGYCGGDGLEPRYDEVCRGDSGHFEAVRVVYDVKKTDYTAILKRFFEIHDPTQRSGQGPDIGPQYRSAIFHYNASQFQIAEQLIERLCAKGYDVVTQLLPVKIFWPAEDYHQGYYLKQNKQPYCHQPVERF